MIKSVALFLGALSLTDAAPLLRRTRRVAFAEFGRGIDPQEEVKQLFREQAEYRLLAMSLENAGSMAPLTVPASDMSMPLSAIDFSMPLQGDMSFPLDADMSFPMDTDFSMPLDEGMMSLDLALSMTASEGSDIDPCTDENNDRSTVTISAEVNMSVGAFADIVMKKIGEISTVCGANRMLSEMGRALEEASSIIAVKVNSVTEDTTTDCSANADEDCKVATASCDVIHENGASTTATEEFVAKLTEKLNNVEGIRVLDDSSSELNIDSNTNGNDATGGTQGGGGLGGAKIGAAVVGSVAVVAVALVLVQRKMSKKREDEKSLDGSASTSQNSTAYNSSLSIF